MNPEQLKDILFSDDDSDEDNLTEFLLVKHVMEHHQSSERHTGSVVGRRNFNRSAHVNGHNLIYDDYFSPNPTYPNDYFRRRFRMNKSLFKYVMEKVESNNSYFTQSSNAAGKMGHSSLQKMTAAIRLLAYGVSPDSEDNYVRMGATTQAKCLKEFCETIVAVFSEEYLRKPNEEDIKGLYEVAEDRGFPGMLGSLDCMHWQWKNCPTSWHGAYKGKENKPTVVLEAVAGHDLWIWHANFGAPGTLNDITILQGSKLFRDAREGNGPSTRFTVNGHTYKRGYYLVDGIYPRYSTFVQAFKAAQTKKQKLFTRLQETYRKDVERAFGVLQSRFAILVQPSRLYRLSEMYNIMYACIILHNMIIEDQKRAEGDDCDELLRHWGTVEFQENPTENAAPQRNSTFEDFLQNDAEISNEQIHVDIRKDLVETLWNRLGETSQ